MCEQLELTRKKNLQYHADKLLLLRLHHANLKREINVLERNISELGFEKKEETIEYSYAMFLLSRKLTESFDVMIDIKKQEELIKHFEIQKQIEENFKKISI